MKPKKNIDIICGIGGASQDKETLARMARNGFSVARLNMSHGDHADHLLQINNIRSVEKRIKKKIQILVDLSGPKIRIGDMEPGTLLEKGDKVILTTRTTKGNKNIISIASYKKMPQEVIVGGKILISDGKRVLKVLSTNKKDEIVCKVLVGGLVSPRRGIHVPGISITLPVITSKDMKDIDFAILHKADMLALSFVREKKDIEKCRKILKAKGVRIPIIAKIETRSAMDHLEEIVQAADGVMVARGDLALDIGIEHVPWAQKSIVSLANKYHKYSIVATQLLDSMERHPVPTRAEISDIANALWGGTDALMLSGETAIGKYPVDAVAVIKKVVQASRNPRSYYKVSS